MGWIIPSVVTVNVPNETKEEMVANIYEPPGK